MGINMANSFDIFIEKGSSLNISLVASDSSGNAINLSGYSARGKVKYGFGSTGILLDLQPTVDASFVSGIINIALNPESTTGLPITKGVCDIEVFNSGDYCFKVLKGYANIFPEVSV